MVTNSIFIQRQCGAGIVAAIVLGLFFLTAPVMLSAQYEGAEWCTDCHPDKYADWRTHRHRFMLSEGENAQHRRLPLPDGESWDNISYVIGGNKTKALYLDEDGYIITDGGDNQYNVLTGEWSDFHPGQTVSYDCGSCHTTGYESGGSPAGLPGISGTFAFPGVQCEVCHGPGDTMNKDTSAELCGSCHNHASAGTILASDGFIQSEGQYNEFMAGPHSEEESCVSCHDPHKPAEFSIVEECSDCHPSQANAYAGSQMDQAGVECKDCHMPPATLSAQALGPHQGDMRTHIFYINTDPGANMFTSDGSAVAMTDGKAAVTLDFVCQRCHAGASLGELARFANKFHDPNKSLADFGLDPGLSGTWWGGLPRSGEGFLIEFAYAGPTLYFFGSFYTYSPDGNLVWLTFEPAGGSVPASGTTMNVNVFLTAGAAWGDDFDPDAVTRTQWGMGIFDFSTCTMGSVALTPNADQMALGYTELEYDLSRVLEAGVQCPTFVNNTN